MREVFVGVSDVCVRWHQPHFAVLQKPVPRVVDHKELGGVIGEIRVLQVRSQLMPQLGGRLWVMDSLRVTADHASERPVDGLGVPDRVLQLAHVLVVVDPDAQPRHAQVAPAHWVVWQLLRVSAWQLLRLFIATLASGEMLPHLRLRMPVVTAARQMSELYVHVHKEHDTRG